MLFKSKPSKNRSVKFLELNSHHFLICSKSFYKEWVLLRSAISDYTDHPPVC